MGEKGGMLRFSLMKSCSLGYYEKSMMDKKKLIWVMKIQQMFFDISSCCWVENQRVNKMHAEPLRPFIYWEDEKSLRHSAMHSNWWGIQFETASWNHRGVKHVFSNNCFIPLWNYPSELGSSQELLWNRHWAIFNWTEWSSLIQRGKKRTLTRIPLSNLSS